MKQALEKHRHMSFICEEYETVKNFNGAESLRTVLAVGMKEWWKKVYISSKILVDFDLNTRSLIELFHILV